MGYSTYVLESIPYVLAILLALNAGLKDTAICAAKPLKLALASDSARHFL